MPVFRLGVSIKAVVEETPSWPDRQPGLSLVDKKGIEMMLVFGDSHSLIWGGRLMGEKPAESRFPLVKIFHFHDALAYNLSDASGNAGKWGAKILDVLSEKQPGDFKAIMLSFGEIDIRTQVIRRAILNDISIEQSIQPIIGQYMNFVDLLRQKTNVPLFLWGPVPSASDFGDWNPKYPNCGSEQDRNLATKIFNLLLEEESKKRSGVYAFNLFDKLVTNDLRTQKHYFPDGCHLGMPALKMITDAFKEVINQNDLDMPDYFDENIVSGHRKVKIKDISSLARIGGMSSNMQEQKPSRVDNDGDKLDYIFHTDKDQKPFVEIDLGFGAMLFNLVIYNRFDAHKERVRSLEILAGSNKKDLTLVYQHEGDVFGLNGAPLEVKMERGKPIRYIRLQLREQEYFHLGKIIILAESFL